MIRTVTISSVRCSAVAGFTHDHLTGLREVAYDPLLKTLVSNPVAELAGLRNGTLGGGKAVKITPGIAHMVPGTGAPADASTADVVINITIPSGSESAAVGVNVLANASADSTPQQATTMSVFCFIGTDRHGCVLVPYLRSSPGVLFRAVWRYPDRRELHETSR